MTDIVIDRKKLAEYIRQHANAIADGALLDLHTDKIETIGGTVKFVQTLDLDIREIPIKGLEV